MEVYFSYVIRSPEEGSPGLGHMLKEDVGHQAPSDFLLFHPQGLAFILMDAGWCFYFWAL